MDGDLTKYLDKKFNKVNAELSEIRADIGINKVNIQEGFKEAKAERAELKKKIEETYSAVDGFIKVVDRLEQEFTLMKEDVRKIKEAIKEKLGIDLF